MTQSKDTSIPDEWYFITSPQAVNWRKDSKVEEIATYGSNNPYINYGATKLRELTLSKAMLEGFSDAKEVEGNIKNLENCMRMIIDEGSGFTAPYCWHVFAGEKSYGTYIIKNVSVSEKMRDMSGKATRAFVDVQLVEVSPYQVTSGIDITSTAVVGDVSEKYLARMEEERRKATPPKQDAAVARSRGGGGGGGGAAPLSEANATPGAAAELAALTPVKATNPRTDLNQINRTSEILRGLPGGDVPMPEIRMLGE